MHQPNLLNYIDQLIAYNKNGQYQHTVDLSYQALNLFPEQPQILMLLALAELNLDKLTQAKEHIEQAFSMGENSAYGYYIKGSIYKKLGEMQQAFNDFKSAYQIDNHHTYHTQYLIIKQNLANDPKILLAVLKEYDEFILRYPNDPLAYQNRSVVLRKLGLYDLALRNVNQSLALNPDYPLAWCNRALIYNILGHFEQGWKEYEWRLNAREENYDPPAKHLKLWQGEALKENEKLLIVVEQGFGDNIQFVRYAILAKQRGINLGVLNHQGIENLLTHNLAKYDIETVKNGGKLSKTFTHYIFMMSLPHYFSTTLNTIPFPQAYLNAEPEYIRKWQSKINKNTVNIGLVWSGSSKHNNNAARSIKLENYLPLFKYSVQFHCLQKEVNESDQQIANTLKNLTLWHNDIDDFSDTAALVEQMDLVISVDTSVAHLSAAMGKPTWILINFDPDFRWLLEREDSPWYEKVRLFRQGLDYDWSQIIIKVKQALLNYFTTLSKVSS